MATLVVGRGVSVVYGSGESEVRALDGVDLEIPADARLAILGRSGSGKTTLLHVLGGLVEQSEGFVEWNGRSRIAYVFQGGNLLPHFTVFENVSFAGHVVGGEADPLELLELVGLADKADNLPSELSGGEAQRAALARGLAQRPELLLCDEPTGHLDSDTGERMLDLIDALQAEFGFALVIATHNAAVADRLGDSVELRDGSIVRVAVPA